MAATSSIADIPTPRRGRLRFSLYGLFLITTCLAIALAITSWSLWDNDERWLLRTWFAAAVTLGLLDRLRGNRGILAAALGGGLAPAILTLQMWQSPSRFGFTVSPWIAELGHNAVLLALFVGGLAAGLLAALGWFAPRMPSRTSLASAALIGLAVAAWWGLGAGRWHPRLSIDRATTGAQDSGWRNVAALSADGRMLAVAVKPPLDTDVPTLELWSIAGRPATRVATTRFLHPVSHMEFSPDGRQLLVVPGALFRDVNDEWPVLWFDVTTALRDPPAQSSYPCSLEDNRFSADSRLVTAVGRGVDGFRRQITIDAANLQVTSCVMLQRRSMAGVHPLGTSVVERESLFSQEFSDDDSAVNRAPPSTYEQLIVAPDDRWLASGRLVVNLQTQLVRRLDSPVLASAGGGKWIVATQADQSKDFSMARLPFFRHCFFSEGERSQFLLIDPDTGRLACSSTWHCIRNSVAVSRDGRVLASGTSDGKILIWDVPE